MQYVLMVLETEEDLAARTDPARRDAYWGAYSAYGAALREAGVTVGGNALQGPETATTVRVRGGDRQVQDGPFADTKERFGGYWVIDVENIDQAMDWASKCPSASRGGAVEIRPVLSM
jgi:hypothetical protein